MTDNPRSHAVINGFYVGITSYADKDESCEKVKTYWRLGFLLGWFVKIALVLYFGPKILVV